MTEFFTALVDAVATDVEQRIAAKLRPQTHCRIDSKGAADPTAIEDVVRKALRASIGSFATGGAVDAIGKPLPKPAIHGSPVAGHNFKGTIPSAENAGPYEVGYFK